MKFIDFFAGIGGFRLGMEMAGHECVGHCEIDKFADRSYRAMHDVKEDEWYADDICRVEPGELPEADIWTGGFPCQAFSVAGKRRGFEDMRGTLIFEIFRLAAERKPKILFLENVKGLLNHEGGRTFGIILDGLWELGYDVQWQVLNSKNFGVPQNRERVFIVGSLGKGSRRKIFPITKANGKTIKQLIGGSQGYRVYDTDGLSTTLASEAGGMGGKTGLYFIDLTKGNAKITEDARTLKARYTAGVTNRGGDNSGVLQVYQRTYSNTVTKHIDETGTLQAARIDKVPCVGIYQKPRGYNEGGLKNTAPALTKNSYEQNNLVVQPVLTPDRAEKRQNGRRFKEPGEEMFTLTAQDKHGVMILDDTKSERFGGGKMFDVCPTLRSSRYGHKVIEEGNPRIRRLTPRECFRLQGFSDEYFERAAKVNSDSQLYKQAGNAVTVNVIYEIAKRLKEEKR